MTGRRRCLISVAAVALLSGPMLFAAEQDTIQAIIPWEAEGQVFQIDTQTLMYLGSMTGIMYIESSRGELHEAFVMCPIIQTMSLESGTTSAVAHCEISTGPDSVAYAELTCDGQVGGCNGKFKLIDGEGDLAGISGEGELRVRSPIRALIADLAAGASLRIGSGLAVVKDLEYRIP